ncbi:hypothetical protein [Actinophytocola sp.]|uniref:hypothetical protein n=1 Tax=Actinophytocola sp. TaxID=1872138 RepID=UPI002ED2078C
MSWVANVMLSVSPSDNGTAADFSEWLRTEAPRRHHGQGCGFLVSTTQQPTHWGGWKSPECDVWAGALNHADLNAVLDHVRALSWQAPNEVQLFIMDQEEVFFRLLMFRDGELRQYAPTSPTEDDEDFFPPEP